MKPATEGSYGLARQELLPEEVPAWDPPQWQVSELKIVSGAYTILASATATDARLLPRWRYPLLIFRCLAAVHTCTVAAVLPGGAAFFPGPPCSPATSWRRRPRSVIRTVAAGFNQGL